MRIVGLVICVLTIYCIACEPLKQEEEGKFYFSEPQPSGVKDRNTVPIRFRGTFVADTLFEKTVSLTKDSILLQFSSVLPVQWLDTVRSTDPMEQIQIDSLRANLKKGPNRVWSGWNYQTWVKGKHVILIPGLWINQLVFRNRPGEALRYDKGKLILNRYFPGKGWGVSVFALGRNGALEWTSIQDSVQLTKALEVLGTDTLSIPPGLESYTVSGVSKHDFRQVIRNGAFEGGTTYRKVRNYGVHLFENVKFGPNNTYSWSSPKKTSK
jgi:hypothetical protein